VLTPDEQKTIDQGLVEIAAEIDVDILPPSLAGEGRVGAPEDIHMAVEARLTEKVGPIGGKLHTGRSRNDQVATDLRLYVRAAGQELLGALAELETALVTRAREQVATVMPGYTHTQRAQPVLLSHHLLAYVEMLRRDAGRMVDAAARCGRFPAGGGRAGGKRVPHRSRCPRP